MAKQTVGLGSSANDGTGDTPKNCRNQDKRKYWRNLCSISDGTNLVQL